MQTFIKLCKQIDLANEIIHPKFKSTEKNNRAPKVKTENTSFLDDIISLTLNDLFLKGFG